MQTIFSQFRIWHIPQIPMKPFHVSVSSVEEAKKVLIVLADYDKFQVENNIKPDYCNVSGLEYYDEEQQEWLEWNDEETGNDI